MKLGTFTEPPAHPMHCWSWCGCVQFCYQLVRHQTRDVRLRELQLGAAMTNVTCVSDCDRNFEPCSLVKEMWTSIWYFMYTVIAWGDSQLDDKTTTRLLSKLA